MHILITAGPTREYLDPVRFFTNGSSGQMGFACAAAAVDRGHKVTLISGPVNLAKPNGVKFIPVVSAADMAREVFSVFELVDCVIMTAAVADYTPAKPARHKIVKSPGDFDVKMKRTTDILAQLGKSKLDQKLIGFAVQDKNAKTNARRKLVEKNLDAIVLNSPSAMGSTRNDVNILKNSNIRYWTLIENKTKKYIGKQIIKLAEELNKI